MQMLCMWQWKHSCSMLCNIVHICIRFSTVQFLSRQCYNFHPKFTHAIIEKWRYQADNLCVSRCRCFGLLFSFNVVFTFPWRSFIAIVKKRDLIVMCTWANVSACKTISFIENVCELSLYIIIFDSALCTHFLW